PATDDVRPEEQPAPIPPVSEALLKAGAYLSVDTRHVSTARAALELGDVIINDVSGLNHETEMPACIAETGARYIVMHNRGNSKTMDGLTQYTSLVDDVVTELQQVVDTFLAAGVHKHQLIVAPRLGFSKAGEQKWLLLSNVQEL